MPSNNNTQMKRQLILTTLGSLMVSALIAHAQDAAPAAAITETPASTPAPEAIVAEASTAPAVETAPAAVTAAPAAAEAPAAANTDAKSSANEPQQLIVIDDTPLLDAIRNLARQAGLNLIIDPKVAYGQPDPAKPGSVTAQPNVSIRWENITAEQALGAIEYGFNHALQREIRLHLGIVQIVARLPDFLGVVAPVPGRDVEFFVV